MAQFARVQRHSLLLATLVTVAGCATVSGGNAPDRSISDRRSTDAAPTTGQKATLARADSAWRAGAYPLAGSLYESIVAGDPSPSSVAVFRLATLRAWDNRLDESVALYRRYVALEPRDAEGRLALARTLAWGGRYASAIAIYDSVIARDATYRDAVLGRAQTLAWAGDFTNALAAYKGWVDAHPTDGAASLEYARALSWNGQLADAEVLYARMAKSGDPAAQKGLARVIGWRGELQRSELAWRQVLETRPNDAEALTGLAQVLRWQGRQTDAESALQLALQSDPQYGDARALLRWVQADLRPSVTMTAASGDDSDNNRSTTFLLDYIARAWWNGAIGGRYTERSANFSAIDSRADAVNVFARWQLGTWQLRGDGGVTRHSSSITPSPIRQLTIGSGALHATGTLGRALTIGMGASRSPFDETALLIANGVVSSEIAGEAELALPARLTLSGAASRARLTGGAQDNARDAFSSTLRWTHNRRWSLAVGARQFGYDTTSADGYFAPRRYILAEASTRARVGGDLGWNADTDLGLGRQSIDFFGFNAGSRLAERVALSAGYRFDPAREISVSGGWANVAAPGQTGGSEYKAYTFALRARMGF